MEQCLEKFTQTKRAGSYLQKKMAVKIQREKQPVTKNNCKIYPSRRKQANGASAKGSKDSSDRPMTSGSPIRKTDCLIADLVLRLFVLNRCGRFCVTLTRLCTSALLITLTPDQFNEKTVGSSVHVLPLMSSHPGIHTDLYLTVSLVHPGQFCH